MLKDYLNEKGLSMYKVAKEGHIPYSTLNDLANGKVEIENCKVSLLLQLAKYFEISLDEVYSIAATENTAVSVQKESAEKSVFKEQSLPDFEALLHERLAPGEYIGRAAENKQSLLTLMVSSDRRGDENSFDFLRRICKKGGMADDAFKKGFAYIVMTDYILAQQDRSPENVFIEISKDGKLKRFLIPASTGNVLFLKTDDTSGDITNQDITFIKKKERKLLKLVADKSVFDINRVFAKEEIAKLLAGSNIPEKRIKKICSRYCERIETFKIWIEE